MRELSVREKLEELGRKIVAHLDEIWRATCPRCHLAGLSVDIEGAAIAVKCETPQVFNEERDAYEHCDFYVIVTGTPLNALPDLSLVADVPHEPKRTPRCRTKRRRR